MTVFVLVHGGWHGGWCWRRVAPLLSGHDVFCPTLTGLGDRAHLARPDTGLADHVADVVAVLELDDLRDVVLVGHSSGGAVITGVAQRRPDRLRELVYLDAFVPAPGQSVFDLLPAARREHFLGLVDASGRIVLDPDPAMDGWGLTVAADRAWVRPRLRPFPVGALRDPLPADPGLELVGGAAGDEARWGQLRGVRRRGPRRCDLAPRRTRCRPRRDDHRARGPRRAVDERRSQHSVSKATLLTPGSR